MESPAKTAVEEAVLAIPKHAVLTRLCQVLKRDLRKDDIKKALTDLVITFNSSIEGTGSKCYELL